MTLGDKTLDDELTPERYSELVTRHAPIHKGPGLWCDNCITRYPCDMAEVLAAYNALIAERKAVAVAAAGAAYAAVVAAIKTEPPG